ncbi:YMGG-like glycine zipper-containing protein [Pedobacter frigoris]|uniref:Glycine zipper 2TM domain-containing protein n=1 Tax=Pedobacter frigoris TaxID=2571272 RepID=A0A4U1CP55_9SPHI|nr:YMGG-like glycine zipper-containing protein [Pedobacter frigoris]TKC09314.1 glycine zipper 2TM domain-containing protein [Pedobacter frigoris]
MKYVFSILAVVIGLSACNNSSKEQELMKQQAVAAVKDSLKLDSFKRAEAAQKAVFVQQQEKERIATQVREEKRTLLLSEKNDAAPAPRQYSETQTKKKGWSSAAKGAVIGAGAGALGGVLVDKKDGRGAIIGGVVGAGAGYLIGRDKDKKSGRVQSNN